MQDINFDLSMEQQFQYELMKAGVDQMSEEQAKKLLLQAARMVMVKDNVIRGLVHDKVRTTGI